MLLAFCHYGLVEVKGHNTVVAMVTQQNIVELSPSLFMVQHTKCVNILEDTTMVFSGTGVSILAPGEVSPGHMMLAPLRMNLMAPLSTCS